MAVRVLSKGRHRDNVSREKTLRRMGYRPETAWHSPPCQECGFDRRHNGGNICAFCGATNPPMKGVQNAD